MKDQRKHGDKKKEEGMRRKRGSEEGKGGDGRTYSVCVSVAISGGEQPLYFLASGVFTLFDSRLMIVCQIWYQPHIIVGARDGESGRMISWM